MKISPKALALTLGILWGVSLFVATLLASYTGYLKHLTELLLGVYPYYEISVNGSFAGLIWGFIEGTICGFLISWIYNFFAPGSAA